MKKYIESKNPVESGKKDNMWSLKVDVNFIKKSLTDEELKKYEVWVDDNGREI